MVQHTQNNKYNIAQKQNKGKNHMIISIDIEKAFDKIQHPFIIKAAKKLGIKEKYLNIIKAIYNLILYRQHHTKWGESESFKVRNKTRVSTFPILMQCNTGNS
jgi:hypothetical protein